MAHPQIAVFARLADGNAQTVRRIEGNKTLLGRTQHSIRHNPVHDELVVTNPWAGAILTFRGGAEGEEAPIRIIKGPKTGLALSDTMELDYVNDEYYVPVGQGSGMIHVFNRLDEGNVAPKRVISASGGLPSVAPEHNVFLVSGGGQGVRVFERTASGDAEPLRRITGGPISGTNGPGNVRWIPGTRNFIGGTRPFGVQTYGDREGAPINYQNTAEAMTFLGVWSIDDSGDVPPRFTIAHDILKEYRGVAIDVTHKEIMVADKTANAIFTFSFPEAWETFEPINNPMGPIRGRGGNAGLFDVDSLRLAFLAPGVPLSR